MEENRSGVALATLGQAYSRRFRPLSPLGDVDDHAISFTQAREPGSFESRYVDEYVSLAAIPSNETVAFCGVEPFYRARLFDCRV